MLPSSSSATPQAAVTLPSGPAYFNDDVYNLSVTLFAFPSLRVRHFGQSGWIALTKRSFFAKLRALQGRRAEGFQRVHKGLQ
jgi:hypothetical protein